MTIEEMERLALERAVEDFTGLWELAWDFGARFPDNADNVVPNARKAIGDLLDRAWVSLYHGVRFDGDQVALPLTEAKRLLTRKESWEEPAPGDVHLRIGATPKGEQAYHGPNGGGDSRK
jgi:hypothetical protein